MGMFDFAGGSFVNRKIKNCMKCAVFILLLKSLCAKMYQNSSHVFYVFLKKLLNE